MKTSMCALLFALALCSLPTLVAAEDPLTATEAAALVESASLDWLGSCPVSHTTAECVRWGRATNRNACQVRVSRPTVLRRTPRAARAQLVLAKLIDRFEAEPRSEKSQALSSIMARAYFLHAEASFEDLLKMRAPADLQFSDRRPRLKKRSTERFLKFLTTTQQRLKEVKSAYGRLRKRPNLTVTQWDAAALARIASGLRHFAQELHAMEIPVDVRSGPFAGDGSDAFCDALSAQAQPMEEQIQETDRACLDLARSSKHDLRPWIAVCKAAAKPIGTLEEKRVVRRIIRTKLSLIRGCYESALQDNPKLLGTLNTTLVVGADGLVRDVTTTSFPASPVQQCVSKNLRTLRFPAPVSGKDTILTHPFHFRPPAGWVAASAP
ncbi:MAG: AgmX/PglI C-terminal domain-containing protein [Myxococcales bacterium]|nr:AgmX/PglI C-terminal domain-containing protein [Myxococcales bacterium]